jgi:hypothetical protein
MMAARTIPDVRHKETIMQARLTLSMAFASLLLAACGGSSNSPRAVDTPPATNVGGSPVTSILTACFDPGRINAANSPCIGAVPLPNNLLFSGTTDLTLNPPVANPANFGDPLVAVSTLDGWSTVAPWSFSFSSAPAPASLAPGNSIRLFEVTLSSGPLPGGGTTGLVRELQPGAEFVAAVAPSDPTGRTVAIVPTSPLKQRTHYLAIITTGVKDAAGNDATPDQTYFLTKRTAPWCAGGVSTDPLLSNATCGLEPLRQLTNSHLAVAQAVGIPRDRVVASWVMTTQSITPVLQTVRAMTQPAANMLVPTGLDISAAGLPPIADIYVGFIDLPYYLVPPSADNPTGPLTGFWRAAPGAYQAPFDQFGLDPTSTNITAYNPVPVANATVRVPVLMTVPNANSGQSRPASGWPVVIFQHGITRNRTDGLAISATLAQAGFAMVSIDQPLHGVSPGNSGFQGIAPFYVNPNNPLMAGLHGAGVRERTFDVDYINNATGAAGPDGIPDASGTHTINLASLLTSRDNLRQATADLFVLAATVPNMSISGGAGDFNASRIHFVGQSLGAIVGTAFLALEPNVDVGLLNVPGGGIAQLLNGSATFGPRIRAGLAGVGVQAGTPAFDQFMGAAQQAIDAADPINYGFASANNAIVLQAVVGNGADIPGDLVIPNTVAGAPLAGTEALIRALGLPPITETVIDPNGVRGAVRFIRGEHGSLLSPARTVGLEQPDPTGFLDVTMEMQRQMATFVGSDGTAVIVTDTSVIRTQ